MRKPNSGDNVVLNRRAHFDYQLGEEIICGMSLSGSQVRLIRDQHAQLKGSFVILRRGELWLNNLTLGSENTQNIKLLVTKRQLLELTNAKQSGLQIIPVRLLTGKRYIKLVIATGRSKKKYDKRETIKERDLKRGRY